MTSKINIIILTLIMGLMLFRMDAYATNEKGTASEYSVDYNENIESDSIQGCKVIISIPYSYSETIPKNPVQTGDETPIMQYILMMGVSILGMTGIAISKKKEYS